MVRYSGFASVYALILVSIYRYTALQKYDDDPYLTGDIDMQAIWCILSAGWFTIVPLLS